MSQSPTNEKELGSAETYLSNWSSLGEMISRGASFSGRERNRCFLNVNGKDFADVSSAMGLDLIDDGRGVAIVDWDQDGDLDVWFSNRTGPRVRMMRNGSQRINKFLSVRLQGKTCNRDAIGARVELHMDHEKRIIKTLRAGEGFLSQSSKWIHFGLGPRQDIQKVVVHWPGNPTPQIFTGLSANHRYQLNQGENLAQQVSPRNAKILQLQPAIAIGRTSTDHSTTFLTQRIKVSRLTYHKLDDLSSNLELERDRLTLVNLWASWCEPCVKELNDLAAGHRSLEQLALNVVALSIENLADAHAEDKHHAQDFLDKTNFPFTVGFATDETVSKLTNISHSVFYRKSDLPLPCSFLIDESNRLVAIYKGPVSIAKLETDVKLSKANKKQQHVASFPFPGIQVADNFNPTAYGMAEAFLEGDYLEDARREIIKHIKEVGEITDFNKLTNTLLEEFNSNQGNRITNQDQEKEKLAKILRAQQAREKIKAYKLLATIEHRRNSTANEIKVLTELARMQPKNPQALANLAVAYFRNGDKQKSDLLLQKLARQFAQQPAIAGLLGETYMKIGNTAKAILLFEKLKNANPNDVPNRFRLAMALQINNNFQRSVAEYKEVVAMSPDLNEARNNLAWLYATCSDQTIKNPNEAIRLATRLCKESEYQNSSYLDTLAKAHEESGNREMALKYLIAARKIAYARGDHSLSKKLHDRIFQLESKK